MCETSLQVTGFEKAVYNLFENLVEGVLAVSPMSEENGRSISCNSPALRRPEPEPFSI